MKVKNAKSWFSIIILSIIFSSCTTEPTIQETRSLEDAEVTLKVAVPPGNYFDRLFQNAIEQKYPKLTLELVRDGYDQARESDNWEEWLEVNQPDLIVSESPVIYAQLLNEGLLTPLDELIQRDGIDLQAFVPGAIEWLRLQDANRQLFGLAVDFQNAVLLYNTEHFDRVNISYPSEKITWTELLHLAQRFQFDEQHVYGLQQHAFTPFRLIVEIGRTEELRLYDAETGEVYAQSPAWKEIWELVISSYKLKSIKDNYESFPSDAAMSIMPIYGGRDLEMIKEKTKSKWRIAYFPISAKNLDASHSLSVNSPISIYNKSVQKEYAWELLKFMVGEDMARYMDERNLIGMPIRTQFLLNLGIENDHILYNIRPKSDTIPDYSNSVSTLSDLRRQYDIGDRIFVEILEGKLTLDEGLEKLSDELGGLIAKPN